MKEFDSLLQMGRRRVYEVLSPFPFSPTTIGTTFSLSFHPDHNGTSTEALRTILNFRLLLSVFPPMHDHRPTDTLSYYLQYSCSPRENTAVFFLFTLIGHHYQQFSTAC